MGDNKQQSSNGAGSSRYMVSAEGKRTSIRQMTPNQFYKVCPTEGSAGFGPPMCGDGTPFCFYVSRSRSNTDKLLVEIVGGGACWDEETCNGRSELLTFPTQFDSFLGLSCSEIQVLGIEANGMPINMLCAGTLGETDLSQYNSIIIPYCTQDVHVGNNAMDYAGDGSVVYHYGARNMQSVLTWIFKNFRRPTDVCLTGCSAGGTAVLPVYRAFHNHYNGGLNPLRTQINAIADSPVYLTPQYFLENALDNWLPDEYFKRLGIPYDRYRSSEEYSTLIWDFILRKGSNKDRFAIVSHTDDPVSQVYYKWMSGNGNNGNVNDVTDEWYQDLTSSVGSIQSKHKNLQTYWIDGEGHCSFGLYYALQESPDFAAFAGDIFRGNNHSIASRLGLSYFFLSIAVAAAPILFLFRRRRSSPDGLLKDDEADMKSSDSSLWQGMASLVKRCPCTAAYGIAAVVYFLIMMFNHGFVHPLNNPSLGPSATALSAYGINNPSLVVLKFQWFRLISSNFVSSGVLALGYVTASLWWRVRQLEDEVGSSFLAMVAAIALFINGVYCLFGQGASTSSVGLVIGLRSLELALSPDRVRNNGWASIKLVLEAAVFALLVPFNNGILLLAALLVGPVVYLSKAALKRLNRDQTLETRSMVPMATKIALVALIVFPIVILVVASPDPIYKDPFYTGCRLFWSDQVEDLASGSVFRSDNNDDGTNQKHRRRRNLIDYDGMCAQFCIPNLVAPLVGPITKGLGISAIAKGRCVDNAYETRAFTKTFSHATYALDVDVYYGPN